MARQMLVGVNQFHLVGQIAVAVVMVKKQIANH
jgi:hypothetical protein